MKYFSICLAVFVGVAACCLIKAEGKQTPDIIRVHIRANSNSAKDQDVKYAVKDRIVKLLSERLEKLDNIKAAENVVKSAIKEIEACADACLTENGFEYTASAALKQEEFPTRVYDGVTFDSGMYNALIVELGSGEGDNWWCVMYPPLCFINASGEGKIKYKSIIEELINKYGDKKD